ncbi:MAG: hypothetical protein IJC43_06175 [Clostridia bacterium]|nr:hypothetical protein [Clostridia bacterium]
MRCIPRGAKALAAAGLWLALLLTPAAAGWSVTESRYIVDDVCDFTVEITDRKESLRLDKKLFSSLLGNLIEKPSYITVIELPTEGAITHGGDGVVVLDTFSLGGLSALRITPKANTPASFCFIAANKEGQSTPLCRLTVIPAATAMAPVAEDLVLETGAGMKVGGQLSGHAPDGGTLAFELADAPSKGDLVCSGSGFVYTPHVGETGRDSFTYVVRDSAGSRSEEATVSLRIAAPSEVVQYCDMGESLMGYAAACLAEAGILRGERVGGVDYFHPEAAMAQGEFLTLLLNAAGLEPASLAEGAEQQLTVAQAAAMAGELLGYAIEVQPRQGHPGAWSETAVAAVGDSALTREDAAGILWQVYCAVQGE